MKIARRLARLPLLAAPAVLLASAACAQSTPPGNSTNGELLWNANACSGCHTVAKQRGDITVRAPAGMSYDKALAALNAALNGADLDGNATGMQSFAAALSAGDRNDIAAYIAGLAGPAPILSYSPAGGAVFPATAVGASSSSTITIRNTGTATLTFATNSAVTVASGGDAADFRVTASSCPALTLPPNAGSCTVDVTFTPAAGASLTRAASVGVVTTSGTSLIPLAGSVAVVAPVGSAANPPAAGGGGGLAVGWLGLLLAVAAGRRRNSLALN